MWIQHASIQLQRHGLADKPLFQVDARLTPAFQFCSLEDTMRYFALVSFLAAAAFAQTAEEFYSRAQQSLADKQMDKVVEDCTRAILLEPGFQEALILRATAYSNLNQRDRAVADLDVVLKEQKKLILVARETPLNLVHIRNFELLLLAGATILPANPSFFTHPQTVEQVVDTVVARVLDHLSVSHSLAPRWRAEPE